MLYLENIINIVFSSDDKFAPYLATTITSILVNSNKDDCFKFYIFNNDYSDTTKSNILKLKKYKDFEIEFINLKEEDFDFLPTRIHYKKQIYYRFKIPKYINEKRVLYLDSDIIVRKSLKDFYNTDLKNNSMAVVENLSQKDYKKTFELDKYFNSGVLLIDVEKIKKENLEEKCVDFIVKNSDKSLFYDQDALNVIFKDNVLFVDLKYNFQCDKYCENFKDLYKKYNKDICILHFTSGDKPWNFGSGLNFVFEYYKYYLMTPWKFNSIKRTLKLAKAILSHYI